MDTFIPVIIDVEASGFGKGSYPIEVGLVFADGRKFCRLIRPEENWTYWDPEAEAVHRISRDILETNGKRVGQVADELNLVLRGMTVYSDCWTVDKPWLDILFRAAETTPAFRVSAIEMILDESQMEQWKQAYSKNIEHNKGVRHRASADAELIQMTWIETKMQRSAANKTVAGGD